MNTASRPNIAIIASTLDGGIGRNAINLSKALVKIGHQPCLLLENLTSPYMAEIASQTPIHQMKTSHPAAGLPFLVKFLRQQSPTAVLTSTVRLTQLALRARTLAARGTHVFANVHNTYSIKYQALAQQKWEKRKRKIRRYYPRCNGIICVSKGVAEDFSQLSGIPRDDLHVIYNPVVTPEIATLTQQAVDHPWFIDNSAPIILAAGRLEEAKNFPLLIDAYLKLRQNTPAKLVILGEGRMRTQLEQQITASAFSQDIALLGHQSNPYQFYARASVFVLSSDYEGLGNVLVEALACGAPVVATDCPNGPREILEDGKWGLLTPPGDVDTLAAAMHTQLTTPNKPTPDAVSRFQSEAVANEYARVTGLTSQTPT